MPRYKTDIKYISRRSDNFTNGWQLKIKVGKEKIYELFSDSKHGGKIKALSAAGKQRDYLVEIFGDQIGRKPYVTKSPPHSTPVTGVYFGYRRNRTNTKRYYCIAAWFENKKLRRKMFNVKKYGRIKAFKLACNARLKAIINL